MSLSLGSCETKLSPGAGFPCPMQQFALNADKILFHIAAEFQYRDMESFLAPRFFPCLHQVFKTGDLRPYIS